MAWDFIGDCVPLTTLTLTHSIILNSISTPLGSIRANGVLYLGFLLMGNGRVIEILWKGVNALHLS
ncbi:uncharacterized protein G2W53_024190 [Senna tora]|uniref:Uncharacterized protein n=1 Tax=Senna tora TaxID=362788 RepID=A0A834WCW4_9FABA|nr:uncharacterized protein G2W53_024190 [Senna tora]